jgi:hypothetical protein
MHKTVDRNSNLFCRLWQYSSQNGNDKIKFSPLAIFFCKLHSKLITLNQSIRILDSKLNDLLVRNSTNLLWAFIHIWWHNENYRLRNKIIMQIKHAKLVKRVSIQVWKLQFAFDNQQHPILKVTEVKFETFTSQSYNCKNDSFISISFHLEHLLIKLSKHPQLVPYPSDQAFEAPSTSTLSIRSSFRSTLN